MDGRNVPTSLVEGAGLLPLHTTRRIGCVAPDEDDDEGGFFSIGSCLLVFSPFLFPGYSPLYPHTTLPRISGDVGWLVDYGCWVVVQSDFRLEGGVVGCLSCVSRCRRRKGVWRQMYNGWMVWEREAGEALFFTREGSFSHLSWLTCCDLRTTPSPYIHSPIHPFAYSLTHTYHSPWLILPIGPSPTDDHVPNDNLSLLPLYPYHYYTLVCCSNPPLPCLWWIDNFEPVL
jgi:hypothetical protein